MVHSEQDTSPSGVSSERGLEWGIINQTDNYKAPKLLADFVNDSEKASSFIILSVSDILGWVIRGVQSQWGRDEWCEAQLNLVDWSLNTNTREPIESMEK